jgi:phytoene dehydrogenase-like protein
LRDGSEVLAAKGVIATCAPQVVYGRLLEKDHQTANSKARLPFIPANVSNMCPFKVDMAVGGPVGFTKAQQKRNQLDGVDIGAASMVTGTLEDHIQHAAALRAGTVGAKPAIWMTVLSHADNSIAPEGESVVYLYTSVPWEPDGGWPAQAQQFSDRLVGRAAQYLDGLSSEIGRHITTPLDFDQQYGTPRGCLYHVDMLPARLGSNRPAAGMGGSQTEISGLYLAGSGSHPSGGVFGMPGKLGAMQAIRDAK